MIPVYYKKKIPEEQYMKLLTKASSSDAVTQRELENLQVAYQAACEGMVLLKNDGALPFKTKKIALYGPGASMTIKGGTGSGEVNERHSVTVLEGLQDRGFEITTMQWIEDFEKGYQEAYEAYKIERKKRINILKMKDIMNMLLENFKASCFYLGFLHHAIYHFQNHFRVLMNNLAILFAFAWLELHSWCSQQR